MNSNLEKGFTTGSCAAAAAKAATYMLFTGKEIQTIKITTPVGIIYDTALEDIDIQSEYVSCGVRKRSGDDPDITNQILICARVWLKEDDTAEEKISIKGGKGVGVVTRPGLEMPIGEWAINSTPRKMIKNEVLEVLETFDYKGNAIVEIFVPEGEEIANKTFNPHMGIEGGISILGTTGIVEPMSNDALLRTIKLDISQKYKEGHECAIMVPGNYGQTFLEKQFGINKEAIIHFSNYIGFAIDTAVELGFKKILIVGHTGKLVKVSGGIMNTHSREADSRMELMAAATIEACERRKIALDSKLLVRIMGQVTTTAVLEILEEEGLLKDVSAVLLEKILYYTRKRAREEIKLEVMLYENNFGLLASSDGAKELL